MDSRRSESRLSSRNSRPSSSLGLSRAASSTFGASTTTQQPKTPKPSAARYGGLAEKDYNQTVFPQIQSSIRTAAKTSRGRGETYQDTHARLDEGEEPEELPARAHVPAPEGSFIADTSFARAPLNSRLPLASPHRAAIRRSAARKSNSATATSGQTRTHAEDDTSDSGSVIEDVPEDEEITAQRERARRKARGLEKEPLAGLSADLQEALIVEDLLFVLMGIEGRYIEFDPSYVPEDDFERMQGAQFVIDDGLDPWIASVVERFLPLSTYFTSITAFIEQYSVLEHGVINHALCAAIREMLRDYLVLLAQLETHFTASPTFTLQRFWLFVHPALHTLSLIHSLIIDLVSLTIPSSDDDTSSDEEGESDDSYAGGGAMANILAEMKSAAAAAAPSPTGASGSGGGGWRAGPPKGGEVLYVLFDKLERNAGDPAAKELYSHLLLKASQPYASILLAWISTGHLSDPWDEFIVRETKGINQGSLELDYTDDYWERRYTLRDKSIGTSSAAKGTAHDLAPRERGLAGGAIVPAFLEPWKDKILLAGKYLNVIRECGIEIQVPEGNRVREGELIAMDEEDFFKRIDTAYTYANKTLLKLLLEEEHLASRLESMKQYFFINHGDVFTHFLDMAKLELGKKKKRIMLERLQTQLDLALRNPTSRVDNDPFQEDLKIVFEDVTVAEWLLKIVNQTGAMVGPDGVPVESFDEVKKDTATRGSPDIMGWDAFNLDYAVKFPLSLVLSRKSITYYQMIFRHLLRLKHLERVFLETWTEHLKTPAWRQRSPYPELQAWKGRVFALRARMYDFIQQMFDFAVSEVLESRWAELKKKLDEAETVDQLLKDHDNFLNTCTNECLLTNEKLLDLFHQKLFNTCYVFANYTASFTRILVTCEHEANGDWNNVKFKPHWEFLTKFEIHFNHHIEQSLGFLSLHAARENSGILPLIVRLSSLKKPQT
ncbi:gamma-tubulin-complex subunit SPC97 [Sporobolomyces koalae]|uniref:gamma-tubulin-complex subunit SPC97 n=1 Tax=Sporobolomyces koalae TaxID=500713 RepID=UPI0031827E39